MSAKQGRWTSDYRQTSGGYELVFSGVLFALAGLWLDRQFDTTPWLTILLAALGFGGALANIYYRYDQDMAAHEAELAQRRGAVTADDPNDTGAVST